MIAAQVDDHIGNLHNLLSGVSVAVSWDSNDTEANDKTLRRVKSELPSYIANLLVFSLDGTNIGTSLGRRTLLRRATAPTSSGCWRASASGRRVIRSRPGKEWVVTVARPVEDADGQLRAVLTVGTRLEHFQDALDMDAIASRQRRQGG